MKRSILILPILLSLLASCGNSSSGKIKIACSFAPIYDFAKRIAGDNAEIMNIVGDAEPHEFQLVEARKMAFIESSDAFFTYGHGIDPWASGLNKTSECDITKGIEFLSSNGEEDPHAWLSFELDKKMMRTVADKLSDLDPSNAAIYQANLQKAETDFSALQTRYETELNVSSPFLVTSHEAFGYLAHDFGLTQIGIGDLADHEPSSSRLKEIVDLIQKEGIRYIFLEELDSPGYVQAVVNELKKNNYEVEYRELSCYECVSDGDYQKGQDFLHVMEENLEVLKTCLN